VTQEPRTVQERALELLRATLATSCWLPTSEGQRLVWAIRGTVVLGLLVLIASAVDKTFWNWLDLLIVPVVLAIGGYLFTRSENSRAQQIATQRAETDQQIEEQRSQQTALQAYLEQITQLVREGLRDEDPLSSLRLLARGRTLSVFWQLDPMRKRALLQMLHEAGLIGKGTPVIGLSGADLRDAYLRELDLRDADLRGADMKSANLERADLSGADLRGADLSHTRLLWASLGTARMMDALTGEPVAPNQADLRYTDLSHTDMSRATGVIEGQFDMCKSLVGATMPNGQKYEDWSKSRGEDGKSSGSS
jgi:uncharacterized protein YjbI with pentapeptide repeats